MTDLVKTTTKHGKPDLVRLGLFIEMPYMHGERYVSPYVQLSGIKGRGMFAGGTKSKCGTQDGYFESKYNRIFEGEPSAKPKKSSNKEDRKPEFRYPDGSKQHSTPGDHYGTFSGIIPEMSPLTRITKNPKKHEPPNFSANPGCRSLCQYPTYIPLKNPRQVKARWRGKMINGPLRNTCYPLSYFEPNPYAEENSNKLPIYVKPKERKVKILNKSPWKAVGPSKWIGGTFDSYPESMSNETKPIRKLSNKKKALEDKFQVTSYANKTFYTTSIVDRAVDLSCNIMNFKTYKPQYTKRALVQCI
ncbi:hypothetical protein RN001_010243 [Aquatica leii]|uniref:Cilia-and flagella-associated protein 96 n=1 Tax=Aquatica leii TaxID=1421715 RepID=A0AAN7P6A1_9COLE|nr:hypothetical protein RN001_010243 [Aquatica leii]